MPKTAYQILRTRLGKQVEANIRLIEENRILREQIKFLEAERRRVDSRLIRTIRTAELWFKKKLV